MRILLSDLPEALTLDHIKEGAALDPVYQKLVTAIRQGRKDQDRDLRSNHHVWREPSLVDGLICRGERIVIPDAELVRRGGNIKLGGGPQTQWLSGHNSSKGTHQNKTVVPGHG